MIILVLELISSYNQVMDSIIATSGSLAGRHRAVDLYHLLPINFVQLRFKFILVYRVEIYPPR